MKKFHPNPILIILILFLFFLTIINCFPCPSECICKPTDILDEDFTRMSYTIDCTNVILNNNQLVYHAQSWSILEDKIVDDEDDDTINDYIISIDLSNSLLLKQFDNKTIQLTGFSYLIQSLSLTNQSKNFLLQSNAFNSILYQNLKLLNLSSCCQQIPTQCPQLFLPLNKLEILDLSGSDMYKSCLNTPNTISSTLRDLILRNNTYNHNTFSHSSQLFNGVRRISGKLDLQYSRFNMSIYLDGNCLFDLFEFITILDLSFIEFNSISNDINIHLKHLIRCKNFENKDQNGQQLLQLYLRQLNLQYLPDWFKNDRFPRLTHLDLSNNQITSIDFQTFSTLTYISLAYNPIELNKINFRLNLNYKSINLRSIIQNSTINLTNNLIILFKLSTNIDYSQNSGNQLNNLTKFPIEIDFSNEISLNISQTNLYSFNIQDISRFDDLYRLDISSNYLIELNLSKQSKLSYLDCSNQKLKILILNKDYSKLIELKCSNNSLKTIENFSLLNHKNIKLIDLSYNSIESLDNLFSNLNSRYLHTINLKSNLINKISSNIFHEKFISLYSIDLSSNKINSIQTNAFQSPNLQILDLTNNLLKLIEPKFLFTSSLRLFFIINNTQQFILHCAESKSNDNLLLTYITWFQQNGTYMKNTQFEKIQQIQFDKCLTQYTSRSKVKWMKFNDKYHFKYLSLYIIIATIIIGIILGIIYMYKKNKFQFLNNLKSYRLLDRNYLIDNPDEFSYQQREDDEIIMNLDEPPFNTIHRS